MEPKFVRLDEVRAFELAAGVSGRPLFGAEAMLNLIRFEPGSTVPLHSHPHEQLGIVLEGMQALVVDGVAHELGPLEAYVLPGGVEHSAYCGPDGALVLDVFTPIRDDYFDAGTPSRRSTGTARRVTVGRRPRSPSSMRYTPAGTPASASVTAAQVVTVETFWSA